MSQQIQGGPRRHRDTMPAAAAAAIAARIRAARAPRAGQRNPRNRRGQRESRRSRRTAARFASREEDEYASTAVTADQVRSPTGRSREIAQKDGGDGRVSDPWHPISGAVAVQKRLPPVIRRPRPIRIPEKRWAASTRTA